jgi:hypothetical protein
MTDSITFGGVAIKDPVVQPIEYPFNFSETQLESGGFGIQASATYGFRLTIRGHTTSHADIAAILAKIGTVGDLVINSTTYSNVMISNVSERILLPAYGRWTYDVSFAQGVVATAGIVSIDGGSA